MKEYYTLLPQDVCDADERCAPCVSPLDGMPTGACDLKGECVGDEQDPGEGNPNMPDNGDDPSTCVHEGDPVVPVAQLTPCGDDAHCFDEALIPADMRSQLASCAAPGMLCVPDLFLESGGNFIPASCRSLADAEGRCLSRVLPAVQAQEGLLPQSTCLASERCVPCYSPLDQTATGACNLSCDPGPAEPPAALPACCEGAGGTCVPSSAVPADQAEQLGEDECPEDQGFVCVPNDFLAGPYTPQTCDTGLLADLFGDEFRQGGCLPECIPAVDNILIGQGDCADGYKCAPCLDPLSGEPSGACETVGGP